ncbi:MAG: isoprenyl transferase [Bacteroidota bacterium]|jgi:undecaprenyl diphosphate synthase
MNSRSQIDESKLPKHIAVIMDGNGRWARMHGERRIFGHHNGVTSVRETSEAAAELGIEYLTLYAFSTENWNRPKEEVDALMELLVRTIHHETKTLNDNNIRLKAIGDLNSLPDSCKKELQEAIDKTSANTRMTLILALSYSSKWELVNSVKEIGRKIKSGELDPESIDASTIEEFLCTAGIPDPELMIRTSGERRVSNFLLWQLSYAEFHFTDTLWPDFRKEDLYEAIISYQQRERRFGKTSEQVSV